MVFLMTDQSEKKKILYVHHGKNIGGAPLSLLGLIVNLPKEKYDSKVLFIFESDVLKLFKDNAIQCDVLKGWFYRKFYKYFCHFETAYPTPYRIIELVRCILSWILNAFIFAPRVLKNEDARLIHLNSLTLTDWAFAAKKIGFKVILHVREPLKKGGFWDLGRKFILYILEKYTDQIIAISKENASRLNGLSHKISVVYDGVDFEGRGCCEEDNGKNLTVLKKASSKDQRMVLYVGGATEMKGFSVMVHSLEYLDPDIIVLFAGYYRKARWYKFFQKTEKSLWKMRSSRNCIEIGKLTNIKSLMKNASVVVAPFSKTHFARPVVEAFSLSKPVVATDVSSMGEIIENNVEGLIVKRDNPKELAKAINFICANEKDAKRMGENGRKKYEMLFLTAVNVGKIEAIYDSM